MLICPGDTFHYKSLSFSTSPVYLITANMKLSLALVTVLATFAVALPQGKGQKQQGQANGQGNNAAAAAGDAAAADGVNAKANNGADVSWKSWTRIHTD